jgi:hypothetical protein
VFKVAANAVTASLTVLACGAVLAGCGGSNQRADEKALLPGIKEFGLTEETFATHVQKVESLIGKCMARAGFEYVPVDVKTVELAQQYVRADPKVARRDYHARWGYGETTRFDDPVRTVGLGPQNRQIFNSLSPAAQEAYNHTLYGENPDKTFVWTLDEEDFSETGGCTRKAVAATFTKSQLLGTYVNPKDVLVESDPRIVKAVAAWTECMRQAGYDGYKDQDEIMEELGDRLDELLDGADPATLTGDRLRALKRLQQEEVDASMADLACEIKHTDDVFRTVEIEVFGQPVSG